MGDEQAVQAGFGQTAAQKTDATRMIHLSRIIHAGSDETIHRKCPKFGHIGKIQDILSRIRRYFLPVTTSDPAPTSTSGSLPSAPRPVQSLGLFSSTALVVGSMVGSGIFIVDADIARGTNSPALFLGAWVVTAILTFTAALSYGELAAMMPRAGGQYVYLRESLGPLWGFLYGWTLFLVIQSGTIAAVAVAFGKFLGVFFPAISTTHWLWHIAHVPPLRVGPMVLGNMEIGVSTANLTGIIVVVLLAVVNIFGIKLGALIQNIFTTAKALSLAALILLAFTVGRNATAIEANFGAGWSEFWKNAGWSSLHPVQVGAGGPLVLVNLLVILAVVQVGSLFSADAWNNITFTAGEVKNPKRNIPLSLILGTGFVLTVYFLVSLGYLLVLPMHSDPNGASVMARGIQHATEDRVATAVLEQIFHSGGAYLMAAAILISTFGCANGMSLAGAARLLCNEPGRPLLQVGWQAASALQNAGCGLAGAGRLGHSAVHLRIVRPVARLHHLRRIGLLHSHHRRPFRAAREATRRAPPLQSPGLPRPARTLYCDGRQHLCRIIAIQAPIHMARPGAGSAWYSGLSAVERSNSERRF